MTDRLGQSGVSPDPFFAEGAAPPDLVDDLPGSHDRPVTDEQVQRAYDAFVVGMQQTGTTRAAIRLALEAARMTTSDRSIYLVDDCTPETIGVFSTFEKAMTFAVSAEAERIRVGELDSPEWAAVEWERNSRTDEWERAR